MCLLKKYLECLLEKKLISENAPKGADEWLVKKIVIFVTVKGN